MKRGAAFKGLRGKKGRIVREQLAQLTLGTQIPLLPLESLEALAMVCGALVPSVDGLPSERLKLTALAAVTKCLAIATLPNE